MKTTRKAMKLTTVVPGILLVFSSLQLSNAAIVPIPDEATWMATFSSVDVATFDEFDGEVNNQYSDLGAVFSGSPYAPRTSGYWANFPVGTPPSNPNSMFAAQNDGWNATPWEIAFTSPVSGVSFWTKDLDTVNFDDTMILLYDSTDSLIGSLSSGNYGSPYYGLSEVRFFGTPLSSIPADYPVQLVSAGVDPVYENMLIPQPVGWLGSDVAHSIPLSSTQNLWLFADTFIGTVTGGKRDTGAAFINSSIGIQDLTALPPGNVDFYWGPSNTSFFPHQAGTGGDLYWPTMGTMLNDELFVFCYNVVFEGSGGFSTPGSTLIRVPNPHDPPNEWTQNGYDLGIGDNHQGFHSAVIVEEPYIYFLGYDDPGDNPSARRAVLARALTADLIAGGTSAVYEFWVEGPSSPEWGPTPENLVTLFEPGITETDIQYDADFGLYYCTTYKGFAPEIYLTTAPALTGPWSEPVCVYQVPEHESVSFDIISYAVRPHPELSTQPGEMILTYATNSPGTVAPLFTEEGLGIYHPRFVRLQLERNLPTSVVHWEGYF